MGRLKPGDLVDHFRIVKPLSSGGMGEVYLAIDTEKFRNVALKVLSKDTSNYRRLLRRFRQEAELYRKISHPNVVGLVAEGTVGNIDYIALEHIRGRSLAEELEEKGALPLPLALSIMQDLVYALHAAHQRHVIHRDIKPHNVMLTEDRTVKLIDFGIAKPKGEEEEEGTGPSEDIGQMRVRSTSSGSLTQDGKIVGTVAYCSPEQLKCEDIDERSDIFSLGVVFYEMFTGRRPVEGDSPSDIVLKMSRIDETVVPPSKLRPDLPPQIERIILKMIRYDPDERYQSLLELVKEMKVLPIFRKIEKLDDSIEARKRLANMELLDSYYWRAKSLLDEGRLLQALKEFDKMVELAERKDSRHGENVELELDLAFCTNKTLSADISSLELEGVSLSCVVESLAYCCSIYSKLGRSHCARLAHMCMSDALSLLAAPEMKLLTVDVDSLKERLEGLKELKRVAAQRSAIRKNADRLLRKIEDELMEEGTQPDRATELLVNEGELLVELGREVEAKECFVKALEFTPYDRDAIVFLGVLLRQEGIKLQARNYRELCRTIYQLMGIYAPIVEELKSQLKNQLEDVKIYEKMAKLYERMGDMEQLWRLYVEIGKVYLTHDMPSKAKEYFLEAARICPEKERLTATIKAIPNIHQVFSVWEITSL